MAHLLGAAVPAGFPPFLRLILPSGIAKGCPSVVFAGSKPTGAVRVNILPFDSLDLFSTVREELGKPCCFGFGESSDHSNICYFSSSRLYSQKIKMEILIGMNHLLRVN